MKKVLMVLTCLFVASSAWAGTAYYGGFAAETGVPVFDGFPGADLSNFFGIALEADREADTCIGFNTLMTTSGPNGVPKIEFPRQIQGGGYSAVNVNVGRIKGGFSLDGTPSRSNYASIPDASSYMWEASWDVPANPMSQNWNSTAAGANARLFIGIDLSCVGANSVAGGAGQMGLAGIEWNVGASAWRLSSDDNFYSGNNTPLATAPTTFAVRGYKQWVGAQSLFRTEYSVDEGTTWSSMPMNGSVFAATTVYESAAWVPLSAYGLDGGNDYMAWSIRGAAANNLKFIVVGDGVPNVNASLDADADGIPNYADPTYDTPEGFGDIDGDGLRDGLEPVWGTDASDPDTDGDGILDGIEAALYPGLNPTVFDSANLPVAGGLGLGLLGLGLAVVGARRIRK